MNDLRGVIVRKRDGERLSRAEIDSFLCAVVSGEAPDFLTSALLATIFLRGMVPEELVDWTESMLNSGKVLDLRDVGLPLVDKHSTGGIGDKVSIPLAPAVAACGVGVPMVSGRGLGHTGGTLDKLEAIPGFSTALDENGFRRGLREAGFAFGAQTDDLVPADKKLYALRDACGLVESLPLIASSILSKKLAEGIDGLVLDVKFGSGAFLPEVERGAELARTMLAIARGLGLRASAYQTCMSRPLGRAIGHALEIEESIACLRGEGPADLRELVLVLGAEMLVLAGVRSELGPARAAIAAALDSGAALERFERGIALQGGDPRIAREPRLLPAAPDVHVERALAAGVFCWHDVRHVGLALRALGGGRSLPTDVIDPAVGIMIFADDARIVDAGAELYAIHHRGGHGLREARAHLQRAFRLADRPDPQPLVLRHITLESAS